MKHTRPCCETCGRTLPQPKPASDPTDLDAMTTAERFAYFKRTAPVEDLKFLIRHGNLSPDLLARATAALQNPTRAENKRLAQLWREQRAAADRDDNRPAIGSERWQRSTAHDAAMEVLADRWLAEDMEAAS